MQIPFHKPSIGHEEIDDLVETLKSGWLTTGPKTKAFEAAFAEYMLRAHAVAVNSCTAALHLALEAIGLQPGDTVVVPTMTFAATAEVVRYFHARPLLVDCRARDLNLDVDDAAQRIEWAVATGQRVRAIIVVHYGGQVAEVSAARKLAQRYGLHIIEDAAHCCPAYYRESAFDEWQPVGAAGEISCFSFYANKTITTGEGGMACTDNVEFAERMRLMSLHGISRDAWKRFSVQGSWAYEIVAPGFKYNMTDVAAAMGLQQLRKADRLHIKRTLIAERYTELLSEVAELILPVVQPDRIHSWHLYVIRLKLDRLAVGRATIIEALREVGIVTSVHWMPLHLHPYYRQTFGYLAEDLPQASGLYQEIISLPIFPDMTEDETEYVAGQLKRVLAANLKNRSWMAGPGEACLPDVAATPV
jgi:dTDP-4-amino-4,6-dideoxygalactose transaminase